MMGMGSDISSSTSNHGRGCYSFDSARIASSKTNTTCYILVLVLLLPIFQPVQADVSVERDDFGLMEKLTDLMDLQEASDDSIVVAGASTSSLALVEAAKRESRDGDPLNDSTGYLSQAELRDTTPPAPDHPRPYEVLLDTSTQPEGWRTISFKPCFHSNHGTLPIRLLSESTRTHYTSISQVVIMVHNMRLGNMERLLVNCS